MALVVALWIVAVLLILAGFVGLIAPALPGPPLVYAGVVVIAAAHGFERIGLVTLLVLGAVTVGIVLVDLAATAAGARRFGGTRWGMFGAAVGLVVGLFFGPLGIVLGPLAGAVLGEMAAGRPAADATRAGWGAFLGLVAGALVKFVACGAMVAAALVAHFV